MKNTPWIRISALLVTVLFSWGQIIPAAFADTILGYSPYQPTTTGANVPTPQTSQSQTPSTPSLVQMDQPLSAATTSNESTLPRTRSNPNYVYEVTYASSPLSQASFYRIRTISGQYVATFTRSRSYSYATSSSSISSLGAPDASPDSQYLIHPYQSWCTRSSSSCAGTQHIEVRNAAAGALVTTIHLRAMSDPLTEARFMGNGHIIQATFASGDREYYNAASGTRLTKTPSNPNYYYNVSGNQLQLHQIDPSGTITTRILYQGTGIDPAAVVVDVAPNGSAAVYSWSNLATGPTEILKLATNQKIAISERTFAMKFTAYNEVALDTYSWDALVYDLNTLTPFNYNTPPSEQIQKSPNGLLTVKDERPIGRMLVTYFSATAQLLFPITESPVVAYTVTDQGIYYVSGNANPPVVKFVSISAIANGSIIPESAKQVMNLPVVPRDRNAVELVKNTGLAWITPVKGARQLVELDRGVIIAATPARSNPLYKIAEEIIYAPNTAIVTETQYHILDAAGKRVTTYIKNRSFVVAASTNSIASLDLPDVSSDGKYTIYGYESWCTVSSSSCARKQQVEVRDLTNNTSRIIALKNISDRGKEVRFVSGLILRVTYASGAKEYYNAATGAKVMPTSHPSFYYQVTGTQLILHQVTQAGIISRILYQGSGIDPAAVVVDVSPNGGAVVYSWSNLATGPTEILKLSTGQKVTINERTLAISFTAYGEVALDTYSWDALVYNLNTLTPFNYNIAPQDEIQKSPNGVLTVKDERPIGRMLISYLGYPSIQLLLPIAESPVVSYTVTDQGIYYVSGHDNPPVVKFVSLGTITSSQNVIPESAKQKMNLPVVPRDRNAVELVKNTGLAWITNAQGIRYLVEFDRGVILTMTATRSNPNYKIAEEISSGPSSSTPMTEVLYHIFDAAGKRVATYVKTRYFSVAMSTESIEGVALPDVSPDGLFATYGYRSWCTRSSSSCALKQQVEARTLATGATRIIAIKDANADRASDVRFVAGGGHIIRVSYVSGAKEYYDAFSGAKFMPTSHPLFYYQVTSTQLVLVQLTANGTILRSLYQGSGIDPAAVVVDVSPNGGAVVYSWSNQAQGPTEIMKISNGQKVRINERTYAVSFTAYNEVALDTYSWDALVYDLNTLAPYNYNVSPVEQIRNSPNGMLAVKDERAIGRLLVSAYGNPATQLILPITESPVVSYTVTDYGIYYAAGNTNPPVVKFVSLNVITANPSKIPESAKQTMALPIIPYSRVAVELVKNTGLAWITNAQGARKLVELDRGVILTTTPTRGNNNYHIAEEITSSGGSSPMTEVLYHILDAAGKRVASYVKTRYFSVASSTDSIQGLDLPDVSPDGKYAVYGYERWCTRSSSSCARSQQLEVRDLTTGTARTITGLRDINFDRIREVRYLPGYLHCIRVVYASGIIEYYDAATGNKLSGPA